MHYHIILTDDCNLHCKYCYEKSMCEFDNGLDKKFIFDFSEAERSEVDIQKLKQFLFQDKNPTLVFYGGEPLLEYKKIIQIIDELGNIPYRMQTNALNLKVLPINYLKKIDKMLISIDGDKERTDYNRGNGVYDKIIENIKWARENKYNGEIVGRMTISQEFPDLYEQVIHIVKLVNSNIFSSIHWQLDVGFYKFDYEHDKIKRFLDKYNKSLEKLVNWWISEIRNGTVYKIYPFIGIVKPILEGKMNCGLRCGSGYAGYTITTNGKVVHCPIMNCIENFKAGTLNTKIDELKKFDCKEKCKDCEVYGLCGGRCMYWRFAELWPKEGNEMICNSIKFYINQIKKHIPEIKELIKNGIIKEEDFNYEENFGPEIIP